jgi:hypothetical protein
LMIRTGSGPWCCAQYLARSSVTAPRNCWVKRHRGIGHEDTGTAGNTVLRDRINREGAVLRISKRIVDKRVLPREAYVHCTPCRRSSKFIATASRMSVSLFIVAFEDKTDLIGAEVTKYSRGSPWGMCYGSQRIAIERHSKVPRFASNDQGELRL